MEYTLLYNVTIELAGKSNVGINKIQFKQIKIFKKSLFNLAKSTCEAIKYGANIATGNKKRNSLCPIKKCRIIYGRIIHVSSCFRKRIKKLITRTMSNIENGGIPFSNIFLK